MNFHLLCSLACGGVLQSDSGVITSPNYPNNYDHDMGCAWEIIAEEGAQIEVNNSLFLSKYCSWIRFIHALNFFHKKKTKKYQKYADFLDHSGPICSRKQLQM